MEQIYGNKLVREMLDRSIQAGRLHHALLFHGPSGVGKFLTALTMVRKMNCSIETGIGCSTCSSCRRLMLPFPFHPDVKIFRSAAASIYLPRRVLQSRYRQECNDLKTRSEKLIASHSSILEELKLDGAILDYRTTESNDNPVDIASMNPSKMLTDKRVDRNSDDPYQNWFLKKLHMYQGTHCFQRSIKINTIRKLQKEMQFHPFEGKIKATIIDDADSMLPPAQNCLLKTLEEPYGNAIIILIVTRPSSLLTTIRSRCQHVPFRPLSKQEMQDLLEEKFRYEVGKIHSVQEISEGRVSKALQTDFSIYRQKEEVFETLFTSASDGSLSAWPIRVADAVLTQKPSEYGDNHLSDFYRWLHNQLLESVSNGEETTSLFLPGRRIISVSSLVHLLDGLTQISNSQIYNPDLKLQLESLLFNLMDDCD